MTNINVGKMELVFQLIEPFTYLEEMARFVRTNRVFSRIMKERLAEYLLWMWEFNQWLEDQFVSSAMEPCWSTPSSPASDHSDSARRLSPDSSSERHSTRHPRRGRDNEDICTSCNRNIIADWCDPECPQCFDEH
jgi:hypothetical protein